MKLRQRHVEIYIDGVWGVAGHSFMPASSVERISSDFNVSHEGERVTCRSDMSAPESRVIVLPMLEKFSPAELERMGYIPPFGDEVYYPTGLDVIGTDGNGVLKIFRDIETETGMAVRRRTRDKREREAWRYRENTAIASLMGQLEREILRYRRDMGMPSLEHRFAPHGQYVH